MREKYLEELNIVLLIGGNLAAFLCNMLPEGSGGLTGYAVFMVFWFAIASWAWQGIELIDYLKTRKKR